MVATILMLIGAMVWGQIISTFCLVLATSDQAGTEFRQRMDDLNGFMAEYGLSSEMRRRLREYYHESKHLSGKKTHQHLYADMSPTLRQEVLINLEGPMLRRIWFLRKASAVEEHFLVKLALSLTSLVFSPQEVVGADQTEPTLYIVYKGQARFDGEMLLMGQGWGYDLILESERLRRPSLALAVSYLDVQTLGRTKLFQVRVL